MKTRTTIRRENLAALVERHGQAGVADTIGKDRNQVYQWLLGPEDKAARNISDRSAAAIEDAYSKPRGWLDQEHLTIQEPGEPYGRESQSAQPDPEILAAAIKLVRLTFEALETEHDQEADGVPTALAYVYLQKRQQRVVTGENVVDFMKALRARSKGESGDGQGIGSAGGSHRAKGAATR